MKTRPTIFISGVSHEFASFRDVVEVEVQTKGCFPHNQPSFGPDHRTVEEMLRRKLHEADAAIHVVGFRFGAEPDQATPNDTRRSYTQIEFDIARELGKPVYVFLSKDASVRDVPKRDELPEDAQAIALQLAHRDAVQRGDHRYDFFQDLAELRRLIAQIPIVASASFQANIEHIVKYAPVDLIGRDDELGLLDDAWTKVRRAESPRPHVLSFVAIGGEGKTSLVAKWAAGLAHQGWPGCDAVFAWSFYSQGTREQTATSSDLFLAEALRFFGDTDMAHSGMGAYDKARRLARLVGERRALLILDGVEPLQYAPTSPTPGELKDQGLAALLKALATTNQGLCVLTTRYAIPDLRAFWQTTAPQIHLTRLALAAGVYLLQSLGVNGNQSEFEKLVEDVQGHALTLNLLGTYLRDAHGGDIRKRDLVKLEEADAEGEHGGHAFRVMDAYVQWFTTGGRNAEERRRGRRAIAVLQMLGLFDRPATADCLVALLKPPAIGNLTEPFAALTEAQRNMVFARLETAKLLTVNRDGAGNVLSLDAHPLMREYFGVQLRAQQPEAWRAAHRRVFEHLCATTKEGHEPSLEDLQPLYQAVSHGCQAGMQQEACRLVLRVRIQRGGEDYSAKRLGAFGADLAAVACFFDVQWTQISSALEYSDQAWLMAVAEYNLRAMGRLTEAFEPSRIALSMRVDVNDWEQASISAFNRSELELKLGSVAAAIQSAELSVTYADRSGAADRMIFALAKVADVLHQSGRRDEAERQFRIAEAHQADFQPAYPLLYSLRGFHFCDLLLATAECCAWRTCLGRGDESTRAIRLGDVEQRATQTLRWLQAHPRISLLSRALNHLTLGRIALYSVLVKSGVDGAVMDAPGVGERIQAAIDLAMAGLRSAGDTVSLPLGLLTRSWFHGLRGHLVDYNSAQTDLDEAWGIAERGPMPLYLADIHLHRARLFFRETQYPWQSPRHDLAEARRLIERHGYCRRREELEDAEAAMAAYLPSEHTSVEAQ